MKVKCEIHIETNTNLGEYKYSLDAQVRYPLSGNIVSADFHGQRLPVLLNQVHAFFKEELEGF